MLRKHIKPQNYYYFERICRAEVLLEKKGSKLDSVNHFGKAVQRQILQERKFQLYKHYTKDRAIYSNLCHALHKTDLYH